MKKVIIIFFTIVILVGIFIGTIFENDYRSMEDKNKELIASIEDSLKSWNKNCLIIGIFPEKSSVHVDTMKWEKLDFNGKTKICALIEKYFFVITNQRELVLVKNYRDGTIIWKHVHNPAEYIEPSKK